MVPIASGKLMVPMCLRASRFGSVGISEDLAKQSHFCFHFAQGLIEKAATHGAEFTG